MNSRSVCISRQQRPLAHNDVTLLPISLRARSFFCTRTTDVQQSRSSANCYTAHAITISLSTGVSEASQGLNYGVDWGHECLDDRTIAMNPISAFHQTPCAISWAGRPTLCDSNYRRYGQEQKARRLHVDRNRRPFSTIAISKHKRHQGQMLRWYRAKSTPKAAPRTRHSAAGAAERCKKPCL